MLSKIKALFLHGLFAVLPIVFTIFILSISYNFVLTLLEPLKKLQPAFLQQIPGATFVLATLLILLIGFLVKIVFIAPIIRWVEHGIDKIPLIRTLYSSIKTLIDFLNKSSSEENYKKRNVVLVEFPRKGFFNIAFLLEPATDNFQKIIPQDKLQPNKKYFKIFMPITPHPLTGFFFIASEDEIVQTDLTFEEGLKTLVSCGLITPDSIKNK